MKAVIFALLAFGTIPLLQAEVISVSQQAPELSAIERPTNGMTMTKVEEKFGAPQEVLEAVGDPPITTWVYERYSVYFEYDKVIHTVLHQE